MSIRDWIHKKVDGFDRQYVQVYRNTVYFFMCDLALKGS